MTGPEFAAAHGNDSSTWSSADIEAQINLAMQDIQPAFLRAHPAKPTTRDCWFCGAPNPATNTICGFCNYHRDDAPTAA